MAKLGVTQAWLHEFTKAPKANLSVALTGTAADGGPAIVHKDTAVLIASALAAEWKRQFPNDRKNAPTLEQLFDVVERPGFAAMQADQSAHAA